MIVIALVSGIVMVSQLHDAWGRWHCDVSLSLSVCVCLYLCVCLSFFLWLSLTLCACMQVLKIAEHVNESRRHFENQSKLLDIQARAFSVCLLSLSLPPSLCLCLHTAAITPTACALRMHMDAHAHAQRVASVLS